MATACALNAALRRRWLAYLRYWHRRVSHKDRQQSGTNGALLLLGGNLPRDFVEAFAASRDSEDVGQLFHSTVTLLARFRGWSTSQPRRTAM